jgi:NAD+ synthase
MKELANDIVAWLKDYAVKNDRKAFVLGVSGGVDSALVSTLCAMTGLPTYCAVLPCQSKSAETSRGEKHIEWLQKRYPNVRRQHIDLTTTFEAFYDNTKYELADALAYANTKSRLRMIALYQIATPIGGIVVGTGNKVEDFGIGFFTKYGDGGVDLSPIADLLKSEVRQMCRDLGVLPELSEAVPTDGLWADARTDEGAIGASYDELEWVMTFLERNNGWPCPVPTNSNTPLLTARQQEVLNIYMKRHMASRHKLEPIPTFVRKSA